MKKHDQLIPEVGFFITRSFCLTGDVGDTPQTCSWGLDEGRTEKRKSPFFGKHHYRKITFLGMKTKVQIQTRTGKRKFKLKSERSPTKIIRTSFSAEIHSIPDYRGVNEWFSGHSAQIWSEKPVRCRRIIICVSEEKKV